MKEENEMKTFQISEGSSNIDLTISNSQLLNEVQECKISEKESCSYQEIIQFGTGQYNVQITGNNYQGIKYIIREVNITKS